jgi:hypothetical protein
MVQLQPSRRGGASKATSLSLGKLYLKWSKNMGSSASILERMHQHSIDEDVKKKEK